MTTEDRILQRIATLRHRPVSELDASTPLTALAADSLDLVELAVALEEDFGVPLGHEDLETVRTVGDLIEVIASAATPALLPRRVR